MRLKVSLDDCFNDISQGNHIGSKAPISNGGRPWTNAFSGASINKGV